ncbi:hypothetical protein BOSE21B_110548 [Bosea sp. 21B]|nr:hypothetical protein BOSE21B_110548 [Bosea sp. 21B]
MCQNKRISSFGLIPRSKRSSV